MTSKHKKNKYFSKFKYLLTLFCLLGLIVYFFVTHTSIKPPTNAQLPTQMSPSSTTVKKPNFAFYSRLQKGESPQTFNQTHEPIIIEPLPKTKNNNKMKELRPLALQNGIDAPKYLIQLASFRKLGEAEEMQAKLALKGIIVNIVTFNDKNEVTWYRLRTPYFSELSQAHKYKSQLKSQKISSLIIKKVN